MVDFVYQYLDHLMQNAGNHFNLYLGCYLLTFLAFRHNGDRILRPAWHLIIFPITVLVCESVAFVMILALDSDVKGIVLVVLAPFAVSYGFLYLASDENLDKDRQPPTPLSELVIAFISNFRASVKEKMASMLHNPSRTATTLAIGGMTLTMLFPPFYQPDGHSGFHFIFFSDDYGKVNILLLIAEWIFILVILGLLLFLNKQGPKP